MRQTNLFELTRSLPSNDIIMKGFNMKNLRSTATFAVLLVAAGANAQQPAPYASAANTTKFVSGSDYAATLAARELIKALNNVPDEKIAINIIDMQTKSATLKATFPGYVCDMELMKNETANKYGWVVQNPGCRKMAHVGPAPSGRSEQPLPK